MIWPLIFVLLAVLFTYKTLYKVAYGFLDHLLVTIACIAFAGIALIGGIAFAFVVGFAMPKYWTGPETEQVSNLRIGDLFTSDGGTFTGAWIFVPSGSTKPYYLYNAQNEEGQRPGSIAITENVTFVEEERSDSELRVYKYKFMHAYFQLFALNWDDWNGHKYVFAVPKGTLEKNILPH